VLRSRRRLLARSNVGSRSHDAVTRMTLARVVIYEIRLDMISSVPCTANCCQGKHGGEAQPRVSG
jgi:hypothetical protein